MRFKELVTVLDTNAYLNIVSEKRALASRASKKTL
jgi:hypothetical protein